MGSSSLGIGQKLELDDSQIVRPRGKPAILYNVGLVKTTRAACARSDLRSTAQARYQEVTRQLIVEDATHSHAFQFAQIRVRRLGTLLSTATPTGRFLKLMRSLKIAWHTLARRLPGLGRGTRGCFGFAFRITGEIKASTSAKSGHSPLTEIREPEKISSSLPASLRDFVAALRLLQSSPNNLVEPA